ncbi:MAG: OmpH family outer membrane protein [Muribaculaceae bacterium]|nr:OmpH family outer membrane protein [Bacteroides sp.]MBD5415112.1 OmpH family outer membrane protein [Bacteroides sp.]MBD5425334.1 OmpH family outer membrane protein [Bacteroides sp.]MDE6228240.1 OmpH family outer membrane protein [Muribaculaceae bacterium]
MRKFFYLASVAAMMLPVFAGCKNDNQGNQKVAGSAAVKTEAPADSSGKHDTPMAAYIRYIDSQELLANYALALEVAKADSAAQIQLASYQNQLGAGLQRRQQQIQEKMQRNGYLSEASYNADVAALQKAQQDAENKLAQRQRDYATDLMNKQQELHDSVKAVVDYLSAKYQLDAVIDRASGLYFNPALDMTQEVLAELNRRYKPAK